MKMVHSIHSKCNKLNALLGNQKNIYTKSVDSMHRWVVVGSDLVFVGGTREALGSAVRWALWLGKCWSM